MHSGFKKWAFLLRGFFPSWQFFDSKGADLTLEIRRGNGDWANALPPIHRSPVTLLINPSASFLHACHGLIFRLQEDILASETPESLLEQTHFKLVRNLARYQLAKLQPLVPVRDFQFRLVSGGEQILLSPVFDS